mmetsp:Transcript_67768/g.150080  ORF Transcript_67768/g.150080 Transcript_67768/m.150080 type:complete len:244 (+) Transcript_67768:122-853(+)
MPPVPPLALTSPHGLGVTTPRSISSRASTRPNTAGDFQPGAAFSRSARHIVTPQVGRSAMVRALGDLKAPWEVSATQKFTPRHDTPLDALASVRPFSVGRARAQKQLETALATQDQWAKVRRLEQALENPCIRYERAVTPRLSQVTRDAQAAKQQLFKQGLQPAPKPKPKPKPKQPMPPAEPALSPEEIQRKEEEAAALRIQSLYRGGKDREAVQKIKEEETKAATKIQSVFRGQAARRELES